MISWELGDFILSWPGSVVDSYVVVVVVVVMQCCIWSGAGHWPGYTGADHWPLQHWLMTTASINVIIVTLLVHVHDSISLMLIEPLTAVDSGHGSYNNLTHDLPMLYLTVQFTSVEWVQWSDSSQDQSEWDTRVSNMSQVTPVIAVITPDNWNVN